jgi:hypothetical protein
MVAVDYNHSLMCLDGTVDDRQSEPAPARLGCKERMEEFWPRGFADSWTGIDYSNCDRTALERRGSPIELLREQCGGLEAYY